MASEVCRILARGAIPSSLSRTRGGSTEVARYPPSSVIDEQEAKRDREQIEEAVIAGDGDRELKKN